MTERNLLVKVLGYGILVNLVFWLAQFLARAVANYATSFSFPGAPDMKISLLAKAAAVIIAAAAIVNVGPWKICSSPERPFAVNNRVLLLCAAALLVPIAKAAVSIGAFMMAKAVFAPYSSLDTSNLIWWPVFVTRSFYEGCCIGSHQLAIAIAAAMAWCGWPLKELRARFSPLATSLLIAFCSSLTYFGLWAAFNGLPRYIYLQAAVAFFSMALVALVRIDGRNIWPALIIAAVPMLLEYPGLPSGAGAFGNDTITFAYISLCSPIVAMAVIFIAYLLLRRVLLPRNAGGKRGTS